MNTWLDTTGKPNPPQDNVWQQARWLVGRYPRMQVLCERVGAIDDEPEGPDGGRWPDVDKLADTIRASDAHGRAWAAYERHRPPPQDDARYDAWRYDGPKPEDSAVEFNLATARSMRAFLVMSGGEKRLLRVLATLSPHRVEFSATSDTSGLDDEGWDLVRDWVKIVLRNVR